MSWLAAPVFLIEIVVILACLASGWRPFASWGALPRIVRIGITIWLLGATISSLLAQTVLTSMVFQYMWMLHGLFAMAVWSQFSGPWSEHRGTMLYALAIGLLVHSVMVYAVAFYWRDMTPMIWHRLNVGVVNPRHYLFYATTMLGLALGFLVNSRSRAQSVFALVLMFAAYHLFAWSGGRNGFIVSLLVPLIFAALFRGHWKLVLGAGYGTAVLAYSLSLITVPADPLLGISSSLLRIFQNSADGVPNPEGYSSGRYELWAITIKEIIQRPLVGHGQFHFDTVTDKTDWASLIKHPHNVALQFLFDWGLLATTGILIAITPFLISLRSRLAALPQVTLPTFAALLALLLSSMLDGTYFFNQSLFLNAVLIAVLASVACAASSQARVAESHVAEKRRR